MRAHVVAVANTKGGVGKTTISGNLTWGFATSRHAKRVLLVDADPQASATRWFDLADELPFERLQLTTPRVLRGQLPRLCAQYDLIVVDCPPMQSDVTAAALSVANLGIVPVYASPIDVLGYSLLVPLLEQVRAANPGLRLRFVVNDLSEGTVLAREVEESLSKVGLELFETMLHHRQVYRRVVAEGSSVAAQAGPARDEIQALVDEAWEVLSMEAEPFDGDMDELPAPRGNRAMMERRKDV